MPEKEAKSCRYLNPPPPQTVPGVILYHEDARMDERIRQVAILHEAGYDLDTICATVERGPTQVKAYFRQIRTARWAYIKAFPEDFASDTQALQAAIMDRRGLDALLRRELYSAGQSNNASNRVGLLKIIMRNMREIEELTGLLVQRIMHSGSVGVKDEMQTLLDQAPDHVREAYLDALTALIHAAEEGRSTQPTDSG